ncbi:MAG: gamma-glutamyl-gamma-aminobutyrate hydrolase family protein [Oscillospiraceae bacterium]|jgi:putative glutamine amidotransferase|nr:gamma-glutamyl-gamma-aminobutyrate hydrolase family protein [Oscillospiraceae bacterium]
MLSKPVICVSSSSDLKSYEEGRRISLPASYGLAVSAAGGLPVLSMEQRPEELAELCDGLLLSGGEDMDPKWYGEEVLNSSVTIDALRDAHEMPLAKAFLERRKPILAICRGFQVLNVVLGGDLWQDLPEQLGFNHSDSRLRHPCKAAEGSLLYGLYGGEFKVNSTHHQAVRKLGEGLWATAWSVEGIVEGYEHKSLPIWGTQFHPERLTGPYYDGRTPDFAAYFAKFTAVCKQKV